MYKLENKSLFKLEKNALGGKSWKHIAVVPSNVNTLDRALEWFYAD